MWATTSAVPCDVFVSALASLVPGVFARNIACSPGPTSVNVTVHTVFNASVAIISYLENITASGDLAAVLGVLPAQLSLPFSPELVRDALCKACTTPVACAEYSFVPETSCCSVCESQAMRFYRLDYGIYLLRRRQYDANLVAWQQGIFVLFCLFVCEKRNIS